jgi:uncharacterized protein (TIGR03067 family)
MKKRIFSALAASAVCLATFATHAEDGFQSIFNGQDLAGWDGNPKLWSVKDGAIVGQTTAENPLKGNTFLIWTNGTTADFELRCSYKITPNNDDGFANSGIQYRSKVFDPAGWVVGGYQADMEAGPTYSGILYEERMTRGIMAARGEKVLWDKDCKKQVTGSVGKSEEIQAAIKKDDWNDYVIIAQGNHLQHFINGKATVDVTDECESKAAKSGVLALQVHAGKPMAVQFKNMRIKQLSGPSATGSDLDRMQGDWGVAELVMNGEKVPADALASAKLKIKASEYFLDGDNGSSHGTLKLGESASPKTMEVTTDDGTQLPAIYEVSGDTMKVCYAINGASRPKEFKSAEGSDHVFTTYKRKAK